MALKIRLQRRGTTNAPAHGIVVAESKSPRDGKFVEELGSYNPNARKEVPLCIIDMGRAEYWISKGAKPSDTVNGILKKARKQEKNEKGIVIIPTSASAA